MQAVRQIIKNSYKPYRRFCLSSLYYQNVEQPLLVENLTIPPSTAVDKPLTPKIEKIINDISNLTLIEVCELNGGLKKRLNLPDAPAFPVGFAPASPSAAEEEEAPQKVKSSFNIKLLKFDEKQKIPLIKEVKALIEGMNLVQAKKFVESAPALLKSDVSKEEADKLKAAIEKVGGEVQID